jgi:hypothetical protein
MAILAGAWDVTTNYDHWYINLVVEFRKRERERYLYIHFFLLSFI